MTATLSKRVSQLTTTVQGLRARHEAIGSQLAVARTVRSPLRWYT